MDKFPRVLLPLWWPVVFLAATVSAVLLAIWAVGSLVGGSDSLPRVDGFGRQTTLVADRSFGRTQGVFVDLNLEIDETPIRLVAGTTTFRMPTTLSIVESGDTLLSVDDVAVVAAIGSTPSYRTLQTGDEGSDVAQLQGLLVATGHLEQEDVDGTFGPRTAAAVRAFNEERGLERTAVVPFGSVVFVPDLSQPLMLSPEIKAGAPTPETASLIVVQNTVPSATAVLPPGLRVGPGTLVSSGTGFALEIQSIANVDGVTTATLVGDVSSFCGGECDDLPLLLVGSTPSIGTRVAARVEVVPEVTGPAVPVVALRAMSNAEAFVETSFGEMKPVKVLHVQSGWALVEGVEAGEVVILPESVDE